MVRRYRQYWALFAAFLIALPLIVGVAVPGDRSASMAEARMLAPWPNWPDSLAGWRDLPRQMDVYLRDHFGLRQVLLRAYAMIMSRALAHSGNSMVLTGNNGWMFFRGNDMVQQSAGMIRRDDRVAEVADLVASMHRLLAVRGTRLLVAPPPNSATIYPELVPLWARNRGQRTEYDVLMDDLAARGITAVDLRPALRAEAARGKVYRMHDTHWTPRGAMVAFNAIVQADSHPDWRLDAAAALGPPTVVAGGDLARMLGVDADVSEVDQLSALPPAERKTIGPDGPFPTYVASGEHSGPTIMIIGDSFTEDYFAPMLLQHVGRVVWLHHQFCRFDWKWVEEFRPDEVWWMPNERYMVCGHGDRPQDLPPQVADGEADPKKPTLAKPGEPGDEGARQQEPGGKS
jgi:alginate O-acetyltransferase complex protein AlgJ